MAIGKEAQVKGARGGERPVNQPRAGGRRGRGASNKGNYDIQRFCAAGAWQAATFVAA
ncbi:hypothetical protein GCM10011378_10650 [Hymenobacter glacieicola]|uniref:Uncharacterized protein n=1 Tax=Hymenobacter glacieicola TaxID=1562124 RepID=A0ABQ1WNS4_9BACT|nr:hypothetical protein GCM10011378_10650 [Hymenobacter glacieicola]